MSPLRAWFDSHAATPAATRRIDWLRIAPYIGLHVACFAVIWTGWSVTALAVGAALYALRMFAITAFYHRYFSHKAFRASRALQLVFAVLGASAAQRGPLWWASHHRHHHVHADSDGDAHSPGRHGILWAHMGWFLAPENFATREERVRDLAKFPELRFLDRYDALVPALLAAALYGAGEWLAAPHPGLATDGPMLVGWGFCVSTVLLYQATFTVNSLAHRFGRQRYTGRDSSRNNLWLALLTLK